MRSVFLEEGGSVREDLLPAEIKEVLRSKRGLLWADLPPDDTDGPAILQQVFGFHQLAVDDCYNDRADTPKIDDYGDYLFIVSQSVAYSGRGERLDLRELCLFLGPNYVVTVRRQPIESVDELFGRCRTNPHLLNRGADFLAHTIIDGLVDLLLPAVEQMDEHIDDLERDILERPDKALLSQVLLLKRNTLRLRRSILPQRDMVNRLSRGEFGALIRSEALIFYRDVYDHIVRVEEMLDGLRDIADSALSSYLSAVNNRMNEIMKAMSVVAVIFLPLTLVASIYGTNLDFTPWGMPGFAGGFALMLVVMVVVAGGLVTYFHRRGWF
jgi:magnesium transporter